MLPDIGGSVRGRTIAVGEGPRWLPRHTAHMRALFASTRGAGHLNPLVPFARAFERAEHELLFAGPADLARAVDAAGFEFWQFDAPPEDELGAVWSRVPELPPTRRTRSSSARCSAGSTQPPRCRDFAKHA